MQRLVDGFRRFRTTYYERKRSLFDALAEHGQSPKAMVISCCDSRVDPGLIFNAEPGDVFVVRNVANLVPPYAPSDEYHGVSAAIEFAVQGLEVKHIVVLGHARCGGIRALMEGRQAGGEFIGPWMRMAAGARDRALALTEGQPAAVTQRCCELEAIKGSLNNLMTFPWIRQRIEDGRLALHGWYFDLESGDLLWLGDAGEFLAV
jgi:carbonic anhydrase